MKRWKIRKYYQLKDYWDVLAGSDVEETFYGSIIANFPMASFNPNASGSNFKNYKNVFYWNGDGIPARWKFLQVFHDCFQQITTRHHEDIIFAIDEDEDTEENRKKVFVQFVLSFIFIAEQTGQKYATLLKIYDDEKDNLMNALEHSTSETHEDESSSSAESVESSKARTRFSDTPELAGLYDDEKYTTNLSNGDVDSSGENTANIESSGKKEVVTKIDPMTIMARIKEIDDNYQNIMLKWVNEFDRLFIDGCNV